MWKRKELKKLAKLSLRHNYWAAVAVCFLLAIIAGKYATSTSSITQYNKENEIKEEVVNTHDQIDNGSALEEFLAAVPAAENTPAADSSVIPEEKAPALKGVLGSFFNAFTASKDYVFQFLTGINKFVIEHDILASLFIFLGALISVLFAIFIKNLLLIGEMRFFMESRTYVKTRIGRIAFLYKQRHIWNPAKIMLLRSIFNSLWYLTIVGGIIKSYEYRMIPCILAENPLISHKEAFSLSKEMMQGQKWKTFVLDVSFLGWDILVPLLFGFVGIFFVNPYITATDAELYMVLRKNLLNKKGLYYEKLNDIYLGSFSDASVGGLYPGLELPHPRAQHHARIEYHRNYSIKMLILFFFTFSFVGWVWEVSLHLFKDGVFVNRGVLLGPWLPIYGSGGVLVLILLKKVIDKPALTFFLVMVICGVVEYTTSWYLEWSKGIKWWDYSGYLFNLNGRICLEGLIVFGLGGCAFIYIVAPLLDNVFEKIPAKIQLLLCVVLVSIFTLDTIHSKSHPNTGKGITDYGTSHETQELFYLASAKQKKGQFL